MDAKIRKAACAAGIAAGCAAIAVIAARGVSALRAYKDTGRFKAQVAQVAEDPIRDGYTRVTGIVTNCSDRAKSVCLEIAIYDEYATRIASAPYLVGEIEPGETSRFSICIEDEGNEAVTAKVIGKTIW